ncbi:dTMP kinase [Methanolinea mesophila]|uniref:dTMP kinase n=1 Tax=Methanolinea mesophila TaxID=547055 RepID=UPI001AE53029|nr:dTMP kinase [Methanolinea mesophila]
MLITLEGIDGSGKSSLIEGLKEDLRDLSPVFTREPGSTWIGEQVRKAVALRIDPVAEALLFAADHAAHLDQVIRPALEYGALVISDRYTDSRFAYQSATLEGVIPDPLQWLRDVHRGWSIRPDHTFLLVLPVEIALSRIGDGRTREHFEDQDFLEKVQENYLSLAREEPARFVVIDAELEKEEIRGLISRAVRNFSGPSR